LAMSLDYFLASKNHSNFNFGNKIMKNLQSPYFLTFYKRKICIPSYCSPCVEKSLKWLDMDVSTLHQGLFHVIDDFHPLHRRYFLKVTFSINPLFLVFEKVPRWRLLKIWWSILFLHTSIFWTKKHFSIKFIHFFIQIWHYHPYFK